MIAEKDSTVHEKGEDAKVETTRPKKNQKGRAKGCKTEDLIPALLCYFAIQCYKIYIYMYNVKQNTNTQGSGFFLTTC